jgi:hypothetical protein
MGVREGQAKDKPIAFALFTIVVAVVAASGVLFWAEASPEQVLIGLEGRHDGQRGSPRLAACLDCHVPFVGTPSSRCLGPGCHGELATGTPPKEGPAMPIRFHVALRDQACGSCHEEHPNRGKPIATPRELTHSIIPKTARERCIRCHSGASQKSHSATDAVSCDLCHDSKDWRHVRIEHARVQQHACDLCHAAPATEVHASIAGACTECHRTDGWTAERPALPPATPATPPKRASRTPAPSPSRSPSPLPAPSPPERPEPR